MLSVQELSGVSFTVLETDGSEMGFALGAYQGDGRFIERVRARRADVFSSDSPFTPSTQSKSEPLLYGGVLWDHYGHFLLESLSRLWACRNVSIDLPIVWHLRQRDAHLLAWQREIFEMLGLSDREHVFITEPLYSAKVIFPEQGLIMWKWLKEELKEFLSVHQFSKPDPTEKIWISRSKLRIDGSTGVALNEESIEASLVERGWRIVHPESLTIRQQLDAISRASELAGLVGSAFHTLLLGKSIHTRVSIVARPRSQFSNFRIVADAKGFRQREIQKPFAICDENSKWGPFYFKSADDVADAVCAEWR